LLIGPDTRMAVVGAPSYFAQRSPPKKPQDVTTHNCINLRLPTHGGLYAWELEKGRRELHVRVDGQLIFNNIALRINAVLEGLGLAFLPEDAVRPYLTRGRLSRVLEDWCPPFSGYHLFTPVGDRPRPPLGYWWTRSDIAEPSPDGGARQKRSQRMTASSKIVAARECLLLGPKRPYRRSAFWTDTGCITCEDRDLRPLGAVHLPCKYV
jgi:hypothetical protein